MLGGTFDPPHLGHLAVAQAAWEQLDVDVVTFLPAGDPWQKTDDRHVSPASVRCEMIAAAAAGVPHFEVDSREADRSGPTYTWDTIESFGDEAAVLVLGADAAAGIVSWYRGSELIHRIEIAVVGRPGTEREDVESAIPAVRWLEMPELDLSSTALRAWIGRGFSARFLVPDPVLEVVRSHSLYSDQAQS
ncbi:MAG: nicotinate-nucleotide adenylyltransferase [Acidimicrobiia bacterium]